ncbi:hypothetical protein CAPTEDRAFT_174334 [Capitella teleta]|uniref:START domain-containing protein n=1 Tax=Capitella teleta TaxID=283909 RepID=R7V9W1_CAPTE|nr:hypothetical protein CAPTEDRAFT_174334 [Capitella teleta]|eukprot:ELU15384.1 hypothetical protein CAPTEDRAFT_174334 [Capitella teleta]
MSPVRRTFCLLVLFDLLITFLIWIIYTQILGLGIKKAFEEEVVQYSYRESTFDIVLSACWRFVPLQLAYALFRIRNPSIVAVMNESDLIFCLFCIFLQFSGDHNHNNIVCYLLFISTFVIAWVEVWFLDFKVLPREAKTRARGEAIGGGSERAPLLHNHYQFPPSNDQYYSPVDSRAGKGHDLLCSCIFMRDVFQNQRMRMSKAKDNWSITWNILHTKDGWRTQQGKSLDDGIVYTQNFPKFGKLFKLEGYVDASPQAVFETTVIKCDEQPKWNPTVLGSKLLQVINETTDISYQIAAEGAGGLVASRDFVSLRHWATKDGVILSSGCAVQHPDAPPTKNYVRGENKAGGWSFFPVAGNPNKCLFIWILGTDLKGWVPQYAVDTALAGTVRDFLRHLQNHMRTLTAD